MIRDLLGSQTKALILEYLITRGGATGRGLAKKINKSSSEVFKALHHLIQMGLVKKEKHPPYYYFNHHHLIAGEIVSIIFKLLENNKRPPSFYPKLAPERKINPYFVYDLYALRGKGEKRIKNISEILKEKYA